MVRLLLHAESALILQTLVTMATTGTKALLFLIGKVKKRSSASVIKPRKVQRTNTTVNITDVYVVLM